MDELITRALSQGLGYGLFVFLLLYVLKTTGEREKNYQTTINKLADKFGVVEDIKKDVEEIKNKIFK
ncbi:BhlA/UviB family holin-like peptide [Clostridium hydrogeniformans]|uniref:BhlA/UviB family holin-like peptide n=1 Tax=Clostridium hydrogeniformans TaxID=349933 RepID=UPI0004801C81|nr:BhlA/UviB family holin-like peptide [Clostridium hydrogeniformans]